jgi:hypothetical protein
MRPPFSAVLSQILGGRCGATAHGDNIQAPAGGLANVGSPTAGKSMATALGRNGESAGQAITKAPRDSWKRAPAYIVCLLFLINFL